MADDLRVLSVRQPWAWQILHEGKDVENRVRSLGHYRGLVAIHASRTADEVALARLPRLPSEHVTAPRVFHYGAILGLVDLTDTHHSTTCTDTGKYDPWALCSPWAMASHWHLELANPRPINPIPATGRLGLWRPDIHLAASIRAALASTTGDRT